MQTKAEELLRPRRRDGRGHCRGWDGCPARHGRSMSTRYGAGQHQAVPLWAVLGVIMAGITNTQAGAQISHTLKAFDCERPTEVMAQAIPEGCSVLAGESPEKIDPVLPEAIRQEYAIVQEVTSYVLSATLCEIRHSQSINDCA